MDIVEADKLADSFLYNGIPVFEKVSEIDEEEWYEVLTGTRLVGMYYECFHPMPGLPCSFWITNRKGVREAFTVEEMIERDNKCIAGQ